MTNWTPEERAAARPPERISLSKHAEKVLVLDQNSAVQGRFLLEMVPCWEFVMDACASSRWDEVTVMAAAQTAKTTTLLVAVVLYYTRQEPSSVGIVLADQLTAEYIMKKKIKQAFEDSPELAGLYDEKKFNKHDAEFTNGAYLGGAWASSVSMLGTRAFRIIIRDEIDKPGYSVTNKEGSALSLSAERPASYPQGFYKIISLSTPTTENGNCALKFEETDAIFDRHCPCPHCGQFQPLKWSPEYAFGFENGEYRGDDGKKHKLGQVVWEGGRHATNKQIQETARYQCGECGGLWTDEQRKQAVKLGKEVSRNEFDEHERKMCLQASRLVSLFDAGSLPTLVQRFCVIMRMPEGPEKVKELQGFINSGLGEPFRMTGTDRHVDSILALADDRPPGVLPGGGVVAGLLGAADTQGDDETGGFWYEVRAAGYGKDQPSWGVRRGYVETKEALIEIMKETYLDADGNEHQVIGCVIDAMGHRTKEIYDFCRHHRKFLYPLKGERTMGSPFTFTNLEFYPGRDKKKRIPGGLQLMRVNATYFKNGLHQKLQISPADPGAWLFDSSLTHDWAKMMSSEYRDGTGFWQEIRSRPNHGWDCSYYFLALAEFFQFAMKQPPKQVQAQPVQEDEPNPYTGGRAFSF